MRPRLSPAGVLVTLPLLLAVACAAPAAPSGSASAAPVAAPSDPVAAYCAANADLSRKTRALASQPAISAAEYAATADAFEQLGAIAPAEVTADLATIARSYRAIGEGRSDLQQVGRDVSAATLRLVDVNTRLCPPTGG
jgi:hypothetical protein